MKKFFISCLAFMAGAGLMAAAPQAEKLDRGVIAIKTASGVFVSWRSFEEDNAKTTFDVYRDGVKVNAEPITAGTNYSDPAGTAASKYVIKAVLNGTPLDSSRETAVEPDVYKRIHLDRPAGGTFAGNAAMGGSDYPLTDDYDYSPNDCSVGDVDGDGEYEIFVKWDPSNSRDNSLNGYTGNVYIDCYKLDGTKLWRVDLGKNIRAGAHYTQFMVYDFDGDGKAEMACKTAPGTVDGKGKNVIMGNDDPNKSYVNSRGHVVSGPEYLTVFDGLTGAERATVAFNPPRDIRTPSQWGAVQTGTQKSDQTNRPERYLAAVAYLDGQKPSIIMCRGYYTASYVCAWDFDGTKLNQRWFHKSETKNEGLYGEGAHSLTIGDVDGDGCDEIVYGAACLDHDGTLLYRTGGGHGDALHLGDFVPDREGLEVFMVHEEKDTHYPFDAELRDARTGQIIWKNKNTKHDIGRGLTGDISDNWRGYEFWCSDWSSGSDVKTVFGTDGTVLNKKQFDMNFRIYWDGDLLDELFDGRYDKTAKAYNPRITKPKANLTGTAKTWTLSTFGTNPQKPFACNTTKATPCLQADILGDWREELILWDGATSSDLLIYTTDIPSAYRVPCLMQDHNYRMAIAWQNVAYNQPPHLGYYLPDRFSTDASLKLTDGTLTQSLELGYAIADIKGEWDKATTVEATGLPAGVTLTADAATQTFTISGTPQATGNFKFKVTTKGGNPDATLEGTITVTESVELTRVAYFSFDAVGATVTNHVQGEATAFGTPVAVQGKSAGAIEFDGTTAYLVQPAYDKIQLGAQDFTVEMLFSSKDDAAYIFHKGSITAGDAAGATGHWTGLELKGGNLKFAVDDNVTKTEVSAPAASYFNGEWHHLVLVREGSTKTLKIYIDGTLVGQNADGTSAINDNNENLVIANVNNNFNNFFAGKLDDFSIYSGAMSANKVAERYNDYLNSGIIDPSLTDPDAPRVLTLVDARSGIIVATGVGDVTNVTSQAAPGVYILITDCAGTRVIEKIVL